MVHRFFLIALTIAFITTNALAEQISADSLSGEIKRFLETEMKEQNDLISGSYSVVVSNLDPRLKLEKCNQPLNKRVASPRPYGNNLSVKVSCRGPKRWTIYVPARIDQFAQVAVVARSLARGTVISEDDITLSRVNIAQVGNGFLIDPTRAVGMELKRSLQTGATVKLSHLKQPLVVKRGDKVIVEASNAAISVQTTGQALSAGQVGEQIKVRNNKSERIVDATVIAPGKVQVSF